MCNSCAMMLELWELFWRIAIYRKSAFVNDQYIACNFKNDRPRLFRVVVSSPYESEGRDSSPSCVLLCFLGNVCVGYNTSRACPRLPIGQCDNGEREVVATWAAIRAKSLISSVVGDIYNFITSMKIHWVGRRLFFTDNCSCHETLVVESVFRYLNHWFWFHYVRIGKNRDDRWRVRCHTLEPIYATHTSVLTYSAHVFILNVERLTSLIVNIVCYESRIKIMIECHVRSLNGVIFERPAITIFGCKVTKIVERVNRIEDRRSWEGRSIVG